MIDVKKKQTIKQSETAVAGFLEDLSYWSAAEAITQLIRAVIADEAAKTQPDEPREDGDVPEWCKKVAEENMRGAGVSLYAIDDMVDKQAQRIHAAAESELTRRVAEAVADKDRRIAEIEAECERLNILIQATAEAWLSLEPGVAWEGAIDAAMKAGVGEIQKLRQQLADATRPVEDVDWHSMYEDFRTRSQHLSRVDKTEKRFREVIEPLLQSERNAREAAEKRAVAAEAERDELREFVRTKIVESWYSNGDPTFHPEKRIHQIPDAELDRLLAAHRAEKGKVQA